MNASRRDGSRSGVWDGWIREQRRNRILTQINGNIEDAGKVALKTHACDRLQGFLFSRPLTPAMFEKYVAHRGRAVHPVSQSPQLRVAPGT